MRPLRPTVLLGAALTASLILLPLSPASAAAPTNDDFDSAVLIATVPFQVTADTTEATRAADDPSCIGEDENTVWYSLSMSTTTDLIIDTFGSNYDTTLSAWTGTRGNLTQVACNDDFASLQSRIAFTADAGVTYYLMAGTFPIGGGGGSLVLNGQTLPPPMQLTVTLDATGSVTPAGAATIHGNVTCSRPGSLSIYGTLREQIGKKATVGSYRITFACSGSGQWQATVLGETGFYRRGAATGVAVAEFVDDVRGELVRVRASGSVQLS